MNASDVKFKNDSDIPGRNIFVKCQRFMCHLWRIYVSGSRENCYKVHDTYDRKPRGTKF
jgi:hypothetical protein